MTTDDTLGRQQPPRRRGGSAIAQAPPHSSDRSRLRRKIPPWHVSTLIALLVAATPVLLTKLLTPSASPARTIHSHSNDGGAPRPITSAVDSQLDEWQTTHVFVQRGHTLDISHSGGMWTADGRNLPYVGPDGYDPATDRKIYQPCKVDSTRPFAYLLAELVAPDGSTWSFAAGDSIHLVAPVSGTLNLRMNDLCVSDNDGVVWMTVFSP